MTKPSRPKPAAKAKAKEGEPNPVGRPTKYDPTYCDRIVAYMGQGYSKAAFAGEIGVSRDTLLEWAATHKEFSGAVKRAEAARTQALEVGLLSSDIGPRVTARIFALKNACPDEWKDKIAHVGGDEGDEPIKHTLAIEFV